MFDGHWERTGEDSKVWVFHRRYRLMSFKRPLAPWRATEAEAEQDALDEGVGNRYGQALYLTVPAWIWVCAPNEVTERGLRPRKDRRLIEVRNPA